VYAVVAGALAGLPPGAPRARAHVAVVREDDALRVRAELRPTPTSPVDDVGLADRVGAVGGTYRHDPGPGSTTITAVIPCAS
jgi:hypothetical protein